jgi:hypothetical protein
MINQILVMLTYNGVDPYYIVNGKFTIYEEEDGFECALLYCDSNLDDMLNELYEKNYSSICSNLPLCSL